MIKIADHHGLYKAPSGAVVNTDKRAYQRAVDRKKEKQRMNELEARLEKMEKLLERLSNVKE